MESETNGENDRKKCIYDKDLNNFSTFLSVCYRSVVMCSCVSMVSTECLLRCLSLCLSECLHGICLHVNTNGKTDTVLSTKHHLNGQRQECLNEKTSTLPGLVKRPQTERSGGVL